MVRLFLQAVTWKTLSREAAHETQKRPIVDYEEKHTPDS